MCPLVIYFLLTIHVFSNYTMFTDLIVRLKALFKKWVMLWKFLAWDITVLLIAFFLPFYVDEWIYFNFIVFMLHKLKPSNSFIYWRFWFNCFHASSVAALWFQGLLPRLFSFLLKNRHFLLFKPSWGKDSREILSNVLFSL